MKDYVYSTQISKIKWDFYLVDNKNRELNESGEDYNFGSTNYETTEIILLHTLAPTMMYQTIKHEVTHALGMSYGLDLNNFEQENICEFIATHAEDIIKVSKSVKKAVREYKKKEDKH